MTRLLFIIIVILSAPLSAQIDPNDAMIRAETAYKNRDYQTAILLYEGLIQGGIHDPVIYFNLGNSYFQTGNLGRALLNYRRTQLFWPRDADLNDNLRRILTERVDIQGDEIGFAEGLAAFTASIATFKELSVVVGLIWSTWFALVGSVILRRQSLRKKMTPLLIVVGVLLLVGLGLLGNSFVIAVSRPGGVIIEEVVPVMSGPGEDYMELFDLHAGADIRIWKVENGWIQFAVPDGRLGWVSQSAVGFVQE